MQKTVLISGGKRGIGKAIAEALEKSYRIFNPSSKEMDISQAESIEKYFKDNGIEDGVDILINNAGIYEAKPFLQHEDSDWEKTLDINLKGAIKLTRKSLPKMLKQEWGRIINISSISAYGEAYAAAYSVSKAALNGLTKTLALEYGKSKITVNSICPGWVKTDMATRHLNSPEKEAANIGATLQNKWIEANEVAAMVNYLVSDSAQAVTGQLINISDGLEL